MVMTVVLSATSLLPSCWHLGHRIGNGLFVFGKQHLQAALVKLQGPEAMVGQGSIFLRGTNCRADERQSSSVWFVKAIVAKT
jgi:hypothetical protein